MGAQNLNQGCPSTMQIIINNESVQQQNNQNQGPTDMFELRSKLVGLSNIPALVLIYNR